MLSDWGYSLQDFGSFPDDKDDEPSYTSKGHSADEMPF